jgi:hypothetical protein
MMMMMMMMVMMMRSSKRELRRCTDSDAAPQQPGTDVTPVIPQHAQHALRVKTLLHKLTMLCAAWRIQNVWRDRKVS